MVDNQCSNPNKIKIVYRYLDSVLTKYLLVHIWLSGFFLFTCLFIFKYLLLHSLCFAAIFLFIGLPGFCEIGPVLHYVLTQLLFIHSVCSFRSQRKSKQELNLIAMERTGPGGPVGDGRSVVELVKIDRTSRGLGVVLCKLYDWALKCEIPDCNREISGYLLVFYRRHVLVKCVLISISYLNMYFCNCLCLFSFSHD